MEQEYSCFECNGLESKCDLKVIVNNDRCAWKKIAENDIDKYLKFQEETTLTTQLNDYVIKCEKIVNSLDKSDRGWLLNLYKK